jgi:hypothetical protein
LPFSRPLFKRPAKHFEGRLEPELRAFNSQLRATVSSHTIGANSQIRRFCTPRPRYVGVALSWLKANNLAVTVSDKDGVFVILQTSTLSRLVAAQMSPKLYRPISFEAVCRSLATKKQPGRLWTLSVYRLRFLWLVGLVSRSKLTSPLERLQPEFYILPPTTCCAHFRFGLTGTSALLSLKCRVLRILRTASRPF